MRTFRRRGGARPRRPMDWEYALIQAAGLATGSVATAFVVLPSELNAEYTDPTLMGGRLISGGRQITGSTANGVFAVGLIAWDDYNNTPPVGGEAPGPIRNGNLDWIVRQVHHSPNLPVNSTFDVQAGDHTVMFKSRRRLGSSRAILWVAENATGGTIDVFSDARVLIKE